MAAWSRVSSVGDRRPTAANPERRRTQVCNILHRLFRNVLLGIDQMVEHVFRCERNCDGAVNGRDIGAFVDQMLE